MIIIIICSIDEEETKMTLGEIILFVLCIIGAVFFGIKKKPVHMMVCIAIAVVMFFLLVATLLLLVSAQELDTGLSC